jgi:hypothetical protein
MQLEYNEIDNYNPRAQARLAKYAEFMWGLNLNLEINEERVVW